MYIYVFRIQELRSINYNYKNEYYKSRDRIRRRAFEIQINMHSTIKMEEAFKYRKRKP